jgi:hypothetical protein
MFFDEYEREYGDGFYPLMNNNIINGLKSVSIIFTYNKILTCWVQTNNEPIDDLDGDTGLELLTFLNEKWQPKVPGSIIINKSGKQIYPKLKNYKLKIIN